MHPLITNFIRGLEMPARPPEDASLQQGELSLPSSVSPPPAANATSAAASLPRAHQGVWKGLPRRVYTIYQSVYSIYSTYQSATPECLHQSATPERLHQSVYTIYSISPFLSAPLSPRHHHACLLPACTTQWGGTAMWGLGAWTPEWRDNWTSGRVNISVFQHLGVP